jgi:hypothetical protein
MGQFFSHGGAGHAEPAGGLGLMRSLGQESVSDCAGAR